VAEPQREPPKPIFDAPSLRIPAAPAYQTTLKQLGYKDADDLLKQTLQVQSPLTSVAFDGAGQLASGSEDGTVKLWDVKSGVLKQTLQVQGSVWSVAFDSGGQLASGSDDGTVKLWDAKSGVLKQTLQAQSSVWSVAFDGGGQLASGSSDGTVKLWDVKSGVLKQTLQAQSRVLSVVFDGDGQLASGSDDGTVKLWDVKSGQLKQTLQVQSSVRSVAFDGAGQLASGSSDGTVKLWDVQSGVLKQTLQVQSPVNSVSFDGGGQLASGSDDSTVKLWDVQSGQLKQTLQVQSPVNSVSFDGGGQLASGSEDDTVKLWDIKTGALKQTLQAQSPVNSISFDGGSQLAAGSDDGTVRLWDVKSGALKQALQTQSRVWSVAFDGSGQLASGSDDGTVKLWDVQSGVLKQTLQAQSSVNSVSFDGSGQLASGSDDGTVKLWDVQSGVLKQTLQAQSRVLSLAFGGGGQLASGSDDGTVKLWDVKSGILKQTLQGRGLIWSVSFDGGGQLASGSDDGTVRLWDVQSGVLKQTLQAQSSVNSVAFDGGGGGLASGSDDGTVKLWDVKSGVLKQTLQAQGRVGPVAFDGGGQLASGSDDGTVKLWDASTGHLADVLLAGARGIWASLFADGKVLRADEGSLLRSGTLLAEGKYPFQEKETDKDYKPTGKVLDKQGDYSSYRWQYLSAPTSSTASLSVALEKPSMAFPSNTAAQVVVKLTMTNSSDQPIHRPRILPTSSEDGSIQVIPADYLPSYPQTEAIYSSTSLIPPGATIRLAARLLATTPQPAKSGDYQIPITVEVSGGETKTVMLTATLQTPDVQVTSSDFSSENHTLNISLENQGTAPLPKTDLYLHDPDGKLELPRQVLDGIAPQAAASVAFTLPDTFDLGQALQLELRPMQPPLYTQWRLPLEINALSPLLQALLAAATLMLLSLTLFYYRRYRHPLVLELGETPQALLRLPPEQLPEARIRLSQTRRLDKVLSDAAVSPQTLQTAIGFQQLPPTEKAAILAQRLGATLLTPSLDKGRDGEGFLSGGIFFLLLPPTFPLNVDRLLLFFPDSIAAEDAFTHLKNQPQTESRITLLLGSSSEYQRKLYNTTADRSNKWVAPQGAELTRLLLDPQPEQALAVILAGQLALQQISPYQIGGGVNKESVFFGRRELIAQIINRDPANYLLVGGRQMGKSTLLKALQRRYADNPQVACHYLSLSNEILIPRIAAALDLPTTKDPETLAAGLETLQRQRGQRFVFLIDEADDFIQHERASNYPILRVFRRLSEQGGCTFILAGFWQLYQHAVLDYQSPIRNFGEVLEVGALEADACRQLASVPMATMNIHYANPALVDMLMEACGQRANLIAVACQYLVQNLPLQNRVIEDGDIHAALHSREMEGRFSGWVIGNTEREQQYDRLVVYATIGQDSFSTGELIQRAQELGLSVDTGELDRTLARLELAFIIGRKDGRWFFRVPLFVKTIRSDAPALKLAAELHRLTTPS
jgi:WD40 repeat protein